MVEGTWLATLIDQSVSDIYVFDENTLALLKVSAAACRHLPCRAGHLSPLRITDVLPDLSAQRLERVIARLRFGATPETIVPVTQRRRDGSEASVQLRLSLLPLPGIVALIAIVDGAPGAACTLRPEQRLAAIEGHVPGLLFQLRRWPGGALQFCFLSQACQDLLGQATKALYADAHGFLNQIVDEDRQDLATKMRQSADTFTVLNWEGRIWITSWQDLKWINLRATPSDEGTDGILWSGLMTNITQGKQQAAAIRQSRIQLAELTAHVLDVREQERERIERDLHDDLGGNLSALKMMLAQMWKQLPPEPFLRERSDYLNQLIDRSIESIHRISADLRPGILDAGLVAALAWLVQEQQRQTGIPCQLHCDRLDIDMAASLATSLFRVAQEACNNVRKHAQASRVDIYLRESGGELALEIVDNGIGIDNDRYNNPRAFGLLGMAERMSALGGHFTLDSRRGDGTTVRVTLPLRDHMTD